MAPAGQPISGESIDGLFGFRVFDADAIRRAQKVARDGLAVG